jgi:galactose mutarotase-like enzyme
MTDKNYFVLQKENVLIRAGSCSMAFLPDLGGKIASIRVGPHELLQAPLVPYAPRNNSMPFHDGDASGWDECLPSVADCSVQTSSGPFAVPDHGDLWRVAWQTVASTPNSLTLRGQCFSLPLTLVRAVTLIETEKGWRISLSYKVTNTGSAPTPWAWSAHPGYAAEADDKLILPASIHHLLLEGSGGGRLGKNGDHVDWPIAKLVSGGQTDLSVGQTPDSEIGDKLFAGPLAPAENWCALERSRLGLRLKVSFDPAATPYLGLWICHGGWPDRPGPKQTCVAIEPTTAPVDSLAKTGPWSRTLAPGESFSWPMIVDIESIERVTDHA